MKAAIAFEPDKPRSAKADERLRLLLIALGHRLNPDYFQASVSKERSAEEYHEGSLAWLDRRAKEGRFLVLQLAAERAIGSARGAEQWMRDTRLGIPPRSVYEIALGTDAGLKEVLDELTQEHRRRDKK